LALLAKTDASHDGKPKESVKGRSKEDTAYYASDGSILGDTSDEDANETCPRYPPSHIEDSPGTDPPRFSRLSINSPSFSWSKRSESVSPEGHLKDRPLQVNTRSLHNQVEKVVRFLHHETQEENETTEAESRERQDLDSNFET
jgi:hypothetical protein